MSKVIKFQFFKGAGSTINGGTLLQKEEEGNNNQADIFVLSKVDATDASSASNMKPVTSSSDTHFQPNSECEEKIQFIQ